MFSSEEELSACDRSFGQSCCQDLSEIDEVKQVAIYKSNKIELISCNHGDAARLVATA